MARAGLTAALLITHASSLSAQEETQTEILAQPNNPLAPLNALNFNNYHAPTLYGADGVANTLNIQGVLIPRRRHFDLFHTTERRRPRFGSSSA